MITIPRRVTAPGMVLFLLCLMYFITYVDRVNVGTAGPAIKGELGLTNTELGLVFSAFAYPYAVFQIVGGAMADKWGARRTLFICGLIWAAATVATGFVGGVVSLFLARFALGFGEGATFPTATRAMQSWVAKDQRGFAQGITHSFARFGNAITPPLVVLMMAYVGWRGAFVVLGIVSFAWVLVWVFYYRDDPREHKSITGEDLERLAIRDRTAKPAAKPPVPWRRLVPRMAPVTLTYFCYGWSLWLYLNWLPSFFKDGYGLDIKNSALFASGVFFAGVVGDTLGGVMSDRILKKTGDLQKARRNVICLGMLGAAACLAGVFFTKDLTLVALLLSGGFFFLELVIGPIWSVPMDIAPQYAGTASGLMNFGSAFAAIVSPLTFGLIVDLTGNWILPFAGSVGLLLLGAGLAFTMHPERPFEDEPAPLTPRPVPAE
ncbi:MFS transporter [Methylorubrum rhodesianum]|jgi:MFS family permease|uniref:MFS transporter n=1 Tax=Methylorubrum rhodesianum TaxID=29427 RepID=A0ABU9ZHM3_9HYPH|nr:MULTISPECIES: MFS transporter [Methylorubrum]MBY0141135.1 MFS transporter [Methylorubrum populi]MRI54255.1 MFS transporter [Methylobacterium sp. DB1607]MBB5761740.1 MFS family permease [Methylorubrum rhodesianum]MBI1687616.1 MFS transporter [Methylorubrum sp. DB1722]MBK3401873.1 MFS transporter [Methylorubrum rhodesianum]